MLAGKRIECLVLAVLAAGFALAGCGGGGGTTSSSTGGEPLTKQELIAKGDAICHQALDQFAQLQQNPPTTPESAATFTQKLIEIQQTQLNQLQDLNPPASLQSSLEAYLKALDKNIAILRQGLEAAQNNDLAGYTKAQARTVQEQVQRLQLARAVGFQECSRPAGTAPSTAGG